MNNENYIVVQGWMINDLKLSGGELLTYALIYGFTQDGESEYKGSISYLCSFLGCSKPTAMGYLKSLCSKELIVKRFIIVNNQKFCKYKISGRKTLKDIVKILDTPSKDSLPPLVKEFYHPSKETLPPPSKETLPNTTTSLYKHNHIDSIDKKEVFSFKKELVKYVGEEHIKIIEDYLLVRKNKKATNSETAFNLLKGQIEKSGKKPIEVITICIEKDWKGFEAVWILNLNKNNFKNGTGQQHIRSNEEFNFDRP